MPSDEIPVILGAAGLIGRQQVARTPDVEAEFDEEGHEVPPARRSVGASMPSSCRRVLSSPLGADRGGGCQVDCPGRQRDGGCLVDLVRRANDAGVAWAFDVVPDGDTVWWDYAGAPIPPSAA